MLSCKDCISLLENPKTGKSYCMRYIDHFNYHKKNGTQHTEMLDDPLNESWADYGLRQENSPRYCPVGVNYKKQGYITRYLNKKS